MGTNHTWKRARVTRNCVSFFGPSWGSGSRAQGRHFRNIADLGFIVERQESSQIIRCCYFNVETNIRNSLQALLLTTNTGTGLTGI